jgi:RimJ/RimL family protein N-acetyltransferase
LNDGVRRRFLPIRTPRLVVRAMERRDVTRFTAYRNDPEVARYQDWELPYTRDHAHALLDSLEGVAGPLPDEWVQLAIEDADGVLVGDLAVWLDHTAELAMIGYTLAPDSQGRGYATEAVGAVVDRLFEHLGLHRVAATLDPANLASARLLERLGFRYEGRGIAAAQVRGEWLDDDRYAVLADERRAWRSRPSAPPRTVALVDVTPSNVRAVTRLAVHHSQQHLVATVAESLADALVPPIDDGVPVQPWFRAVEADGELAGFVMIADRTDAHPVPHLWRLLVDRRFQGRGIGARVVALVAQHARDRGATELGVSYVDGPGGPSRFYEHLGFRPTGEVVEGEVVARASVADLVRP